jgi:uncharacterized protein YqkB
VLEGKLAGTSFGKTPLLVPKGKLTIVKFSSWCNVFYDNVLGLKENILCNVIVINSLALLLNGKISIIEFSS